MAPVADEGYNELRFLCNMPSANNDNDDDNDNSRRPGHKKNVAYEVTVQQRRCVRGVLTLRTKVTVQQKRKGATTTLYQSQLPAAGTERKNRHAADDAVLCASASLVPPAFLLLLRLISILCRLISNPSVS